MADLLDLASLASYVYTPNGSLPSDWGALQGFAAPDIDTSDGFYAQAFKDVQTGEIVIAIRGTVPTLASNIEEDLELGLVSKYAPVMNALANDAIAFAKEVAQGNPGATITLAGHSLGGYAAQAALVRLTQAGTANVSAVTFNAPGLPTWFLGNADPASFNSYNFNTQGDIIHTYGGTQIGESTILNVGQSPAQEMVDYDTGFLAGIRFGAKGGEAAGLAYVAYKDWLTAAHTIGNFVGTNSYTGQQGIFSANTTLGSETAQQFFADGQQIPPSPQLSVSPDGTISLSDTAGDMLSVQAVDGNLQGSLTPGSGLGVSNLSGLQSELQADGSGVVSQAQLNNGATSLPGGSSLFGTLTTGLGGDTSAVIGSEAPGSSAGLPGQIYVPDASSDGRYECNIPVTGTVSEAIDSNGVGTVWVDSSIGYGQLTGGSAVQGTPSTWTDSNGTQYTFSGSLSSSIGTLTITGGLLGNNPADSITIQNFNLAAAATTPGGFLGISLAYTLSLTAGTGAGSGSSAIFPGGSEQSYTLSVDAPSGSPETVVLSLAGANASDFEVQIGNTIEELDPSGAFTVTLPVGATSVSFGLIDVTPDNGTSDIADGTTLTLTASVANPTNPNGSPIQSSPLSITYTPQTPDTSTVSTPGDVISGTLSGGVTTYGDPSLYMHDDQARHNPTIGYGFNLRGTTGPAFTLKQVANGEGNVFTASDFVVQVGDTFEQIDPSGGFTVTLPDCTAAHPSSTRQSLSRASELARRVSVSLSLVLCVILGSASALASAQTLHLSKRNISVLYGKWETIFGNSNIETVMQIRATTIAVGGSCAIPYTVLNVRLVDGGKFYVVEIKESEPATRGAPIRGKPGCSSDGWPFVGWRLIASNPWGGLPALEVWGCSSYEALQKIDEYSWVQVPKGVPQANNGECGGGGIWSPVSKGERF